MAAHVGSTTVQRTIGLAVPIVVAAWFVTVPNVLTPASFFAFVTLVAALTWVAVGTYANGQPAASLAQTLRDADRASSLTSQRRTT